MAGENEAQDVSAEELAAQAKAEADEQLALKEFTEGYTGNEPESTDTIPPTEVVEPVVETPVPEVVVPVVELPLAKLTEAQLTEIVQKSNSVGEVQAALLKFQRDSGGRIGGIEQALKELKEASSTLKIDVADEDFAELGKEFPDLTKQLVAGLSRVLAKAKVASPEKPAAKPQELSEIVASTVAAQVAEAGKARITAEENAHKARTIEFLSVEYPNWRTVVGEKDSKTPYRDWLKSQGEVYEAIVLGSNDSQVIASSLNRFQSYEKAQTPAPAGGKQTRSDRLAEAVPAKGGGGIPPQPRTKTPQEEFREGYANG